MRKHLTIGLLAVGLLDVIGPAQTKPPQLYGYGVGSCGEWLHDSNGLALTAKHQWLLGYVTGVSVMIASAKGTPLRETDGSGMFAFIDRYCEAHPLDRITTASAMLVQALSPATTP